MASKAARKRRRLENDRQRLASLDANGIVHTRCSDVTLAELDVLLVQADELLGRIAVHAVRARTTWPQVPAAYELRATIDEVAAAATSGRGKLTAVLERTRRFQRSGVHVHLCGDLAVRMVPLAAQGSTVGAPHPDLDDDHAHAGDDLETSCSDDIPF
jgi:hypothetical protein